MSIENAIIIDESFLNKQIILTKPDELAENRSQIIITAQFVYVATEKNLSEQWVTMGAHKIAHNHIQSVHRIIGTYLPLEEMPPAGLAAEIESIKARLAKLETRLLNTK